MIHRISFLSHFRRQLRFATLACLALCLVPAITGRALGQAVPAATWPTGDTSPTEQPLPGQMLGTDLTLNQGVNSINAENASFDRFGLGLSALGGAETNFLGSDTNKKTVGYAQFAAEAAVSLRSQRTRFFALYQPAYDVYPQYSEVNNFAQRAYLNLTHAISEHADFAWNATSARYLSLNQFLPQALGVGGVGVVIPTLGAQIRQDSFEITNVATSLRYRYLMSTRMTFTGTLISGLFIDVPADVQVRVAGISQRLITSGADVRLDYQLRPRDVVGGEVTAIYVYGLRPGGHEVAETIQGTYQRQLGATWSAKVAAGPLFIQASSPLYGSIQSTNYSLAASVSHQVRQSQLSLGYSRAFIVSLLSPGVVGNSVNFTAYVPLRSRWILTAVSTFAEDSGKNTYVTGHIFGASSQLAYQVQPRLQLFASYALTSDNYSTGTSQASYGYTRNLFGAGIRFNLGNPITPGGVQ